MSSAAAMASLTRHSYVSRIISNKVSGSATHLDGWVGLTAVELFLTHRPVRNSAQIERHRAFALPCSVKDVDVDLGKKRLVNDGLIDGGTSRLIRKTKWPVDATCDAVDQEVLKDDIEVVSDLGVTMPVFEMCAVP